MMLSRKEKMKTPLYRLTKLLPKFLQSIHEDFKKIRREICIESPRGFETESNSRFYYGEYEHAATPYDAQRNHMASFAIREREE